MAVTKETYTAAATWTAAQLATLFEDAFVDAGLMTAWYDTFLSGTVENRILEITYDGAKTYGTTYYWFMFTTTTIGVSVASEWDATTHVPTGTQYVDYFATTTNATTNHYGLRTGLATGTGAELVRYTASGYSWFAFRNGATPTPFFIAPASTGIAPWIDLDKVLFHHFITGRAVVTNSATIQLGPAYVIFASHYGLRRSYWTQGSLRSSTVITQNRYISEHVTLSYAATGNKANDFYNYYLSGIDTSPILVPYGFNNTNPAYTTDYAPIINGYSYSNYTTSNMPADFGIFFNYGTTAFAFGDLIVVSAGVEEWEVYGFANDSLATSASALILARVV
jgi:hypothetical protein